LERQTNINSTELKNKEKKQRLGILLPIGIIGSKGGLWEGRQRERKLIAKELFWWLEESMNGGGGKKGRRREF
jgi:hypothetical protein